MRKNEYFCTLLNARFLLIPAGTFMMGLPEDEPGRCKDEMLHKVTISKSFYMQTTPVTQGQWQSVMGSNPSWFRGPDYLPVFLQNSNVTLEEWKQTEKDLSWYIEDENFPVERVSWYDIQNFIEKLNRQEGAVKYRLPTEAEWEYACRAGSTTAYCFGAGIGRLGEYAWYGDNSGGRTNLVGQKKSNAWGLYDMHGNVWEWVSDWYGDYPSGHVTDPPGPSLGLYRVHRGGSWGDRPRGCQSANRYYFCPVNPSLHLGFRLLRTR
jgi:formylglycine-generating enzyme required for sulfatase activity